MDTEIWHLVPEILMQWQFVTSLCDEIESGLRTLEIGDRSATKESGIELIVDQYLVCKETVDLSSKMEVSNSRQSIVGRGTHA